MIISMICFIVYVYLYSIDLGWSEGKKGMDLIYINDREKRLTNFLN